MIVFVVVQRRRTGERGMKLKESPATKKKVCAKATSAASKN